MSKIIQLILLLASASLAGAQTLQTLCSFSNFNGGPFYAPAFGISALTQGNDGNLYGTTYGNVYDLGHPYSAGEIFRVTTNGVLTTLFSFTSGYNGSNPEAALTLGADGNFYGTTTTYGSGYGNIFKVTTNGVATSFYSFSGSDGAYPTAALTLGNDGFFYGTTHGGGYSGSTAGGPFGTIFKVATNGVLTPLFSFANTNGANPAAGLTQDSHGNFYGTTYGGGSASGGTVFRLASSGVLSTLVSFAGTNGANPYAALNWGNDGNLYGTTYDGGISNYGTLFRVTTNGDLTTLVSFVGTNGASPSAVLTPGPDGNLYGTTGGGGSTGMGTIFQVTTNGVLTTVFSFGGANGSDPQTAITLGSDGNSLFGTTAGGGAVGYGTVYHLSFPFMAVQPISQTRNLGATTTFSVNAISFGPVSFQWQRNGTNLVNGGNVSGATGSSLVLTGISDSDAANYSVVISNSFNTSSSSNAVLTVSDSPAIAQQPLSQTISAGSNVTFFASAYGAPPLVFQWYYGSSPVGSPTSGTNVSFLTLTNVQTNQSGIYSVKVINGSDSATSSNATLTVVAPPPVISAQPSSRTNVVGTTATFLVVASGSGLNYQWQQNGTNLANGGKFSGVTTNLLTISGISSNEAGIYSVSVTNLNGGMTSSNATLSVMYPPVITIQPLSQNLVLGNGVVFNVAASGIALNYQWYFNGASLPGATNVTYAITASGTNSTGNYSVVVTNLAGSVTSSNAILKVLVRPVLNIQLLAGYPFLNLNGMLSNNFVVQYNTNLTSTNWSTLLSISNLQTSPYSFLDPAGDGQPARFYRALMQ